MRNSIHIFLLSGFVLSAVLAACSARTADKLTAEQTIDEIIWEDWGPVVAPQYNRTFRVTLSRPKQTLSIDSLRTAGVEVIRPLPAAEFDRILALKTGFQIEIGPPLEYDGCLGGSGQSLTFRRKGETLAQGDVINCGRGQRSNIKGNLEGFTQAIKELAFGK